MKKKSLLLSLIPSLVSCLQYPKSYEHFDNYLNIFNKQYHPHEKLSRFHIFLTN